MRRKAGQMPGAHAVSRHEERPVAVRRLIGECAIMAWPGQSSYWLALSILLLAGCATPVIDPSDIELEAVEYGLFEPAEEAFRHVDTRADIAASRVRVLVLATVSSSGMAHTVSCRWSSACASWCRPRAIRPSAISGSALGAA